VCHTPVLTKPASAPLEPRLTAYNAWISSKSSAASGLLHSIRTTTVPFTMGMLQYLTDHPGTVLSYLPHFVAALFLLHTLQVYWRLRNIPGPFWAKVTNIPRLSWVWSRRAHSIHIDLHRKYGPLVRFGPNMVSCGDPAEVPNIYGFSGKYRKVCRCPYPRI
jgi:hypothetical protein